jgi:hypothetical protein
LGWVVRFDDVALAAGGRRGGGGGAWRPSRPWSDQSARSSGRQLTAGLGEEAAATPPPPSPSALDSSRACSLALGLTPERLVVPVEPACDVQLLADAQDRLGHVVDHQAEQEEHLEDGERHRQVLHQLLLAGRHLRADAQRAATMRCWTK